MVKSINSGVRLPALTVIKCTDLGKPVKVSEFSFLKDNYNTYHMGGCEDLDHYLAVFGKC